MKPILLIVIITLIKFNFFNNVNAQLPQCIYNGLDYSFLSNGSYSSLSSDGQYRYYWNICGSATQCNLANSGIAACQIKIGTSQVTNVGNEASGTFKTLSQSGGIPALNYITNTNPCKGGMYRSINIGLQCGSNPIITASTVSEISMCSYEVTMTGQSLCNIPTATPTETPTETPTATPTQTPTQTPNPVVQCQNNNGQLVVNSNEPIVCRGIGLTNCTSSSGNKCGTDDNDSKVICSTPDSSMVCSGNTIQCQTSNFICSISSNNILQVNGFEKTSNNFNSATDQAETTNESLVKNSSSPSSFNIISSMFIFVLALIISIIV